MIFIFIFKFNLINNLVFNIGYFFLVSKLTLLPYTSTVLISKLFYVTLLQTDGDDCDYSYELFSVIIHKGGCYGGHYHVYIRDIDQLGQWEPPVRKKMQTGGREQRINRQIIGRVHEMPEMLKLTND